MRKILLFTLWAAVMTMAVPFLFAADDLTPASGNPPAEPDPQTSVSVSSLGYVFYIPTNAPLNCSFEGTLLITDPAGEQTVANEGEELQPLPPGSQVEVFKGSIQCSSNEKGIFDMQSEKETENIGEAKTLTDGIVVADPAGDRQALPTNAIYPFGLLAPATADIDPDATPVPDFPPADSRNITQSP